MKGESRPAVPVILLALALASIAGCSPQRLPPRLQVAPPVGSTVGPLNLCPIRKEAPPNIAAASGYAEYLLRVERGDTHQPIADLKQSDVVASYGSEPADIRFFAPDSGRIPVSIVVVLDSSGSMSGKLGESGVSKMQMARDTLSSLLNQRGACDEVAIMDFASRHVRVIQSLTTDHALAIKHLGNVTAYGQTPLYDSIHAALQILASSNYPDRALIVLTDGIDNVSVLGLKDVITQAIGAGVPIYTIGLGNSDATPGGVMIGNFMLYDESAVLDAKTLKALADATGGRNFIISSAAKDPNAQFTAAAAEINDALGQGYVVGLISNGSAPSITVANHQRVLVHVSPLEPAPAARQPASAR